VVEQMQYKVIIIKQSQVRTCSFGLSILRQIAEVLTVLPQNVTTILTFLNPRDFALFLFVAFACCE
jgi:hypothetical protein